jgi:type III restriction enzyme
MKLKFDPSLEYQKDAIQAVVDIFKEQLLAQSTYELSHASRGQLFTELGIRNDITLDDEQFLENTRIVQERNNIEKIDALQSRNFSIEMETGTGKTYVYLRTIFELNKIYGFSKFIIVVPSVAIREGVLKSIDIMKEHFRTLYNNVALNHFVYDSSKLGMINAFARDSALQIMIINIQSFQRDANIFNQERENGYKPKDVIASTNPIVIIDEPQSVDGGERSQEAIKSLEARVTLRYSATHKNLYNLLYKLDPIKAYDLRLVKRIEVASIQAENNFNEAYVKLLQTDNKNGIKAYLEIHRSSKNGNIKPTKVSVKQGDDLFVKSGEHYHYKDGYLVQNIDCTPGSEYIEFSNGHFLRLGQDKGGQKDDIMRAQISETIEQHLKKELFLKGKGIKVLSLFFIDKVSNYRVYNDGSTQLGKIGQWFEEEFKKISSQPKYQGLISEPVEKIHNGYFSKDRQGRIKDTVGTTKDDDDTYNLIMKDKERLLSLDEPLRFIFSHSALREGWDNPNIFQICTLNETKSGDKKRQEIGRGLRLPVNTDGDRIHDENINRLTVIANESYEEFAKTLQNEFEQDCGIKFGQVEPISFSKIIRFQENESIGQETSKQIWQELFKGKYITGEGYIMEKFNPDNPDFKLEIADEFLDLENQIIDVLKKRIFKNRIIDARQKKEIRLSKPVLLSAEFRELWDRIKHKTRYRVKFDTSELISSVVERIKKLEVARPVRIFMKRAGIDIKEAGIESDRVFEERTYETASVKTLPDIITFLQKETELTRSTLVEILKKSNRLNEFRDNPQAFMSAVKREISRALQDLMLNGLRYEKTNHHWEMKRLEQDGELIRCLNNLYEIQNKDKSLFDCVEIDSTVEKEFAEKSDYNEEVRLFVKLPRWFKIDTPIGLYNPDWALVIQKDEKLYFVAETKSTFDDEKLRISESYKIKCAGKHFEAIGVSYKKATKLSDILNYSH